MTTDNWRRKRIQDALRAYQEKTGPRETMSIDFRGRQELLPVIELPLDAVLLNSKSHRLKAQLESHAERDQVEKNPWGEAAQQIIGELLRTTHDDFGSLKASLLAERQRDAGLMTCDGVLLNANTRTVALRLLNDETRGTSQQLIRVGVLPSDIDEKEQAKLELQLQVQKELKAPYTLTNELLFIEDLSRNYNMTAEEIAVVLRWGADARTTRKGAADVEQRRRILTIIREMQRVPTQPIPLTFFDEKLEQLKALEQKYFATLSENPEGARRYRDSWLCASRAGAASVHDLRVVDEDFIDNLKSYLEDQPAVGAYVDELFTANQQEIESPAGVDLLDPELAAVTIQEQARRFLDVLAAQNDITVRSPEGETIQLSPHDIRDEIAAATRALVAEQRAETRSQNRLDEPTSLVREAVVRLRKARTKYASVARDLGRDRRGKLEYQLRQARKAVIELEAIVGVANGTSRPKR